MPEPRVTAVVPLHNHAAWVWGAVESVAVQDYKSKRIVVVDDGSTDGSHERVVGRLYRPRAVVVEGLGCQAAWVGTVPNNGTEVTLVRFDRASGPSFARNRGMELGIHAHGAEVFAFLDSDDLYEPGKISKSVARLRQPGVGAVYSDFDTLRPDGLRLRQWKEPFSRERLMRECIVNCDSLVSAEAIRECDGFDETMRVCEDFDLWVRVSEKFLVSHVAESLVTIRVGQHSSTATVASETWRRCHARVFEKAKERVSGKSL